MPFTKHPDPISGGEIEIFEGVVDFVSIKEKKEADRYGKTHTVSVCVDGADGKNGTWMSFPAVTENRIRDEGKAVAVQDNGKWYNLCKGFKIRVPVVRNGDWINPQVKALKVLEEPSAEQKEAVKSAPKKGNTYNRDDFPIGGKVNHARHYGSFLASRLEGVTISEGLEAVHIATAKMKAYLEDINFGSKRDIGNAAGNAVISACYHVNSLDTLFGTAKKMQDELWDNAIKFIEEYDKPADKSDDKPAPAAEEESEAAQETPSDEPKVEDKKKAEPPF